MTGEKNLQTLLASMTPVMLADEYVFCTIEDARYGDHADLDPIASFLEPEGLTLVIPRSNAGKRDLSSSGVFKAITLSVHSSLDAVGLTAAFATRLSEHGISANVIAGYYHDHIFVQQPHAELALQVLIELSQQAGTSIR